MSPRAAWRLEQLGFIEVYDFVHGKSFWLAHGLPTQGLGPSRPRVASAIDKAVPVCRIGDTIAVANEVLSRTSGWTECIVVNDEMVVAGRLRATQLDNDPATNVGAVMEPGPTTIRPDEDLATVTDRMSKRNLESILVTDPAGRLIGALRHDLSRRPRTVDPR